MSSPEALELQKMIRGFRVSDLHSLLIYAGRNKAGKKSELQHRALELIKISSPAIEMKIRELHRNRYQQSHGTADPPELFNSDMYSQGLTDPMANNYVAGMAGYKSTLGPGNGLPSFVAANPLMARSLGPMSVMNQYPLNPDVEFTYLPFYDVLNVLLKPTSLVPLRSDGIIQEKELIFYLSSQDVRELNSNHDVQVQFRIGVLESNKEQEDDFPSSVCVKINNTVAPLPNPIQNVRPGQEPKRPGRPLDLTNSIIRSPSHKQTLCVSWASNANNCKAYVTAVFLVRRLTSAVLIKRLKDMGVRNPDQTTAMIKEKLCQDRDSEIATTSLRGSLICPLGKLKMNLPCRAHTCNHLQCFDATLYIQMNEKKPKWICPVCDKPAVFKQLAIDGLFLDISRKAPSECNEVQFHENGSWTPVMPIKKEAVKAAEVHEAAVLEVPKTDKPKKAVDLVVLDSDSDTEEDTWSSVPAPPPKKKPYKPPNGGVSVLAQNLNTPDITAKSLYMYQPSSSKSVPSNSKSTVSNLEKGNSSQITNDYSYLSYNDPATTFLTSECILDSPTYNNSTVTPPPPQSSSSGSTFQEPAVDNNNAINNSSNSAAGQCYNFDLYSLLQPNQDDGYQYQADSEDTLLPDEEHDIISID